MKTLIDTDGFARIEQDIAGVRTVAYVAGSGPDVVYFHGGGTWHGFDFARDWIRHFRIVLPYHPNFGESGDAPAINAVHDYVSHYRALFDALRLDSIHLVGASLGARIAAEFAAAYSKRLRSLVLVSPAGLSTPGVLDVDYAAIKHDEWPGYFAVDRKFVQHFWPAKPDAEWVSARGREAQATGRALGTSQPHEFELRKRLQRIGVPTLLLWGKDDRMVPAGHAYTWQALIQDSQVEIIEHAGHLLLDESAPARAAVARFMRAQ
ncbi:MAG: alpha/beta fold hydrolase [Steroidobacteraceae bacterium]